MDREAHRLSGVASVTEELAPRPGASGNLCLL